MCDERCELRLSESELVKNGNKGLELFAEGSYEEAKPFLMESAKRPDATHTKIDLAYIYLAEIPGKDYASVSDDDIKVGATYLLAAAEIELKEQEDNRALTYLQALENGCKLPRGAIMRLSKPEAIELFIQAWKTVNQDLGKGSSLL